MTTVDLNNGDSISTLHSDIIQTQILTRLDGPSLAATASTSSYLQTLCTEQKLWKEISTATWPSVNDPRVVKAISSFPSGYRSFFADSYPFIDPTWQSEIQDPPTKLISAVDLYHRGELILSKVEELETEIGKSGWFLTSPFRVDILDPKESIKTRVRYPGGDYESWVKDMEESMRLNWIVIDPIKKRAANISSRKAVSARRNWLTGDLEIRFSTVVEELATEVAVVVSCGSAEAWKEVDEEVGGEVHVRDVRLRVEDIEGKCLKGKDSLVILRGLLEGKRCKEDGEEEEEKRGKRRYEEYVEVKKQWREKKERREKAQDTICMIFGFSLFVLLWSFLLLR